MSYVQLHNAISRGQRNKHLSSGHWTKLCIIHYDNLDHQSFVTRKEVMAHIDRWRQVVLRDVTTLVIITENDPRVLDHIETYNFCHHVLPILVPNVNYVDMLMSDNDIALGAQTQMVMELCNCLPDLNNLTTFGGGQPDKGGHHLFELDGYEFKDAKSLTDLDLEWLTFSDRHKTNPYHLEEDVTFNGYNHYFLDDCRCLERVSIRGVKRIYIDEEY